MMNLDVTKAAGASQLLSLKPGCLAMDFTRVRTWSFFFLVDMIRGRKLSGAGLRLFSWHVRMFVGCPPRGRGDYSNSKKEVRVRMRFFTDATTAIRRYCGLNLDEQSSKYYLVQQNGPAGSQSSIRILAGGGRPRPSNRFLWRRPPCTSV